MGHLPALQPVQITVQHFTSLMVGLQCWAGMCPGDANVQSHLLLPLSEKVQSSVVGSKNS